MKKVLSIILMLLLMTAVVIEMNSSVTATPETVIQCYRTQIVTYATNAIGSAYASPESGLSRFGPNSYDCSGLAYKAYVGVNIPSSNAAAQAYYQTVTMKRTTSYANRRSGDLIFYNLYSGDSGYHGVDHVAICAGNGYIIDAGRTNGVIRRVDTTFKTSSVTDTAVPLY